MTSLSFPRRRLEAEDPAPLPSSSESELDGSSYGGLWCCCPATAMASGASAFALLYPGGERRQGGGRWCGAQELAAATLLPFRVLREVVPPQQAETDVLDNLKDYAVWAVVNAVGHLGTVAYKLTDLFEQQASEISTFGLKVAHLNQQIFTCQIYTDKKGLRQQQMMGTDVKHHKHYTLPCTIPLPSTGYTRTQAVAHLGTHTNHESKPRPYPSGAYFFTWFTSQISCVLLSTHHTKQGKTFTFGVQQRHFPDIWHQTITLQKMEHINLHLHNLGDTISSKLASDSLYLLGKELPPSPMRRPLRLNQNTKSDVTQKVDTKDQSSVTHVSTFNSFDNPRGREIQKAPVSTKSMLATLFIKHKSVKMKKVSGR